MARERRRPGRRRRTQRSPASDLQSTLETLVRTTLDRVGVVKDAALRQARSSRAKLDEALLQRRRREAVADLGEAVYELIQSGCPESLEANSEVADLVAHIAEIDAELAGAPARASEYATGEADGPSSIDPWLERFEGRSRSSSQERSARDADVVSSADWTPPEPKKSDPGQREIRVWRPAGSPDEPEPETAKSAHAHTGDDEEPPARRRRRSRGGGGISFVSDVVTEQEDDLAQYMNDDDVPGDG